MTVPNSAMNAVSGSTSARTRASNASASARASACSAATCRRAPGMRSRRHRLRIRSYAAATPERGSQGARPAVAELEERRDVQPASGPARDVRDPTAPDEVFERRNRGDEPHLRDGVAGRVDDSVHRRAVFGGVGRGEYDECLRARGRLRVDDAHGIARVLRADDSRFVGAAHLRRDGQHHDSVFTVLEFLFDRGRELARGRTGRLHVGVRQQLLQRHVALVDRGPVDRQPHRHDTNVVLAHDGGRQSRGTVGHDGD